MPAVLGQNQPTNELGTATSTKWPKSSGRPVISKILPAGPVEANRLATARTEPDAGPRFCGPYNELDVGIDAHKTFWCYLRPDGIPSFTHGILHDLADMQRSIKRMFADSAGTAELPIRHFVVASRTPGIFNMGGDLGFFAECIRTSDRVALTRYARACIEVVYNNATSLDLPIVTIALVQGDALGGGFEAVLSCNVIVAEKNAKMGLPEILFNLFPGMGAYSLLARKLDAARAERMILSRAHLRRRRNCTISGWSTCSPRTATERTRSVTTSHAMRADTGRTAASARCAGASIRLPSTSWRTSPRSGSKPLWGSTRRTCARWSA